MAKPPYQVIADEIRQRIASGELAAGARVPSARQITAQWSVAIATATKALAVLRQEGVVKAVPGVGTVVAGQAKLLAAANVDSPSLLDRARIVAVAMQIADTEGFAALSMRRIATELNVATMSLYRYVRGKDELVLHMIDAAFGESPPPPPPQGWRNSLDLAARFLWALFRRHRWLASVMSLTRPQMAPNGLLYTDWVLNSLDGLGLDEEAIIHIHVMLFSYVRGLATSLEAEAEAEQDTGLTNDEWMVTQESTIRAIPGLTERSVLMRIMLASNVALDLDSLFDFGLKRLLDGLAVLIASHRKG
ncbi:GntR family transcriptional regulator [Rhizocola hellebori]|uniref:GntR family transcriptional regulator n=1 Tax=Rhizocola hellebori TaxID=1392758 RepID=A0A8J3QED3_9ACTN|nr:TetR/AcrR family transcriptional regulator C-terminal domain-containing protein [Rhizocola hellebori]GIH08060.1 GntR family transcriptional regulator [Rhizocola hellebori]